jgi:hypothetical protein
VASRLERGTWLAGRLSFDLGSQIAYAGDHRAPDPRWSVASGAAETPPASEPLDREELDGALDALPRFDGVPGGIVLGRTATADVEWADFELALDERGLALVTAAARHYFPERRPEVLRACLAFVLRADRSDVLIDIDERGTRLAPEFAGTPLAGVLAHADGAPRRWISDLPWCKTTIVDQAIAFTADPAAQGLRISAILDLRVYAPAGRTQSLPCLLSSDRIERGSGGSEARPVPRVPGALASDLEPVIELAGILGVLRWAEAREPGCVAKALRRAQGNVSELSLASAFASR